MKVQPCPYDTDADGNCGQKYCPFCSTQDAIAEQRRRAELFPEMVAMLDKLLRHSKDRAAPYSLEVEDLLAKARREDRNP